MKRYRVTLLRTYEVWSPKAKFTADLEQKTTFYSADAQKDKQKALQKKEKMRNTGL